jgi:adenylate cyclase
MAFSNIIKSDNAEIFRVVYKKRKGQVVPETSDIVMKDQAVMLDATYLYADLAGSSQLAQTMYPETTATILRAFLRASSKIIRQYNGHIRSFDGDRVMGIFIGPTKNDQAVRAGLGINWAVSEVIHPAIKERWNDVDAAWKIGHGVGIDTGEAMLVTAGIRDNSDIISIGPAPNVAAKLSSERAYKTWITKAVLDELSHDSLYSNGSRMWSTSPAHLRVGAQAYTVYGSNYWWEP